ncbi:MAG: transglycosylase SLT domain-containing protein [Candidatus Malihini olakiniferum]
MTQITQIYAMTIARQESAWNHQACSSVGASVLMQLLPATMKSSSVNSYVNSS